MSQVITNRVRTSRRSLLKGTHAAGARIAVGCRRWCPCSTRRAPRMRRRRRTAQRSPSRAASCCGSTATAFRSATGFPTEEGSRLRPHAMPGSARSLRKDIHVLSGVDNAAASGTGNGHHELHERSDDRHGFHRPRPERTVDRPGRLRRRSAAIRASARFRSACRRNRSARACSAT